MAIELRELAEKLSNDFFGFLSKREALIRSQVAGDQSRFEAAALNKEFDLLLERGEAISELYKVGRVQVQLDAQLPGPMGEVGSFTSIHNESQNIPVLSIGWWVELGKMCNLDILTPEHLRLMAAVMEEPVEVLEAAISSFAQNSA